MISRRDHDLFTDVVDGGKHFVLVTHVHPDGDALGSQLGLARFLMSRGKQVDIVNVDAVPRLLGFLDRGDVPIRAYDPGRDDEFLAGVDTIVLLDNSAPDRLGPMEAVVRANAARTVCIDHHPTRGTPWGRNILDDESCAAASMVWDLVRAQGWDPDEASSEALYVGLATDTGFFRYNSTRGHAHRIAADLLDRGVNPARAYQEIYERNSAGYTRLLGAALADLRVDAAGKVVSVSITRELVDRVGVRNVDTSEMTTPLLALDGVAVAILFRELGDGQVKVSLRSKGARDVQALAAEFGGGGHRNASGIVTGGTLDDVRAQVLRRASVLVTDDEETA